MPKILLEVCVDSPAGLHAAVRGGADRIELCAALALGGLTPSPGLMRLAAAQPVPSFAMIRPQPGPFRYDAMAADALKGDLDAVAEAGLPGAVIGASLANGGLDLAVLAPLVAHAQGLGLRLTLHRAFDLAPDLPAALEQAVALGFERVLTSGGAPTALEGAKIIARLVEQAAGRLSVMPGCGVGPDNIAEIIRQSGASEVHGSFSRPAAPAPDNARRLGFEADRETDETRVAVAAAALRTL
jgi:copper homeostasis protein